MYGRRLNVLKKRCCVVKLRPCMGFRGTDAIVAAAHLDRWQSGLDKRDTRDMWP